MKEASSPDLALGPRIMHITARLLAEPGGRGDTRIYRNMCRCVNSLSLLAGAALSPQFFKEGLGFWLLCSQGRPEISRVWLLSRMPLSVIQ